MKIFKIKVNIEEEIEADNEEEALDIFNQWFQETDWSDLKVKIELIEND